MFTPKETADMLGIPTSTLRRWAARYEKHLSSRRGKVRAYTTGDLAVMRRVQLYLGMGHTMADVESMLQVEDPEPEESTALVAAGDFARSLELAHKDNADLRRLLEELITRDADRVTKDAERDALVKELIASDARYKDYFKLPWWKRIFYNPPKN